MTVFAPSLGTGGTGGWVEVTTCEYLNSQTYYCDLTEYLQYTSNEYFGDVIPDFEEDFISLMLRLDPT